MTGPPYRIAVVGGGTAGWICALALQDAAVDSELNVEITVIESSEIPTIGVGEGTTAAFNFLLRGCSLDELEFIRETEATIKFGIRHKDWRRKGHSYDGPIDDPRMLAEARGSEPPLFNLYCLSKGKSVTYPHLFTYLIEKERAPYISRPGKKPYPLSPFDYAYHFDQALVGRYLRSKAKGIDRLDATVADAELDGETGDIRTLVFSDGHKKSFDFFFDCTGFRRALICGKLNSKWISYADALPVNRAMPFWLEHSENSELPPYTLAWAQGSGWMWQIPTQRRMGCGYVYSDEFLSPDQAQAEIESVLGFKIEPRADIRINSGRVETAWIRNCVALGLAQSFFEPLEATSVHGIIIQTMLFVGWQFKSLVNGGEIDRDHYNSNVALQVDDFMKFINTHYVSNRTDTPFWRHVKENCIADEVKSKLELWSTRVPYNKDFNELPGNLPHVQAELYFPVLDGLGLLNKSEAKKMMDAIPRERAKARRQAENFSREFRIAASKADGHRKFLRGLQDKAH